MAYERRDLRPFDTLDRTQTKLNQMLRVQSPPIPDGFQPPLGGLGVSLVGVTRGSIAAPGGTLVLDRDEYLSGTIGLYFGTHDDDWLELTKLMGQELDSVFGNRSDAPVSIVVTATNTRLKQVDQLMKPLTFDQWCSGSWRHVLVKHGNNANRPRQFRMPHDGCVITVQVLLHSDLPAHRRVSGRPWRKGSWLARSVIRVSSGRGSGLAPTPLTPAIRSRFGLGEHTSSFIDIRGDLSGLCMVTDLSDVLTVYIDDELLHSAVEVNQRGDTLRPGGGPLIARWVMDTYRSLVHAYSRDDRLSEFEPSDEQHRQTYLYSLLSEIEASNLATVDEALLILRDEPFRFIALVEHVLGLRATDKALLELKK